MSATIKPAVRHDSDFCRGMARFEIDQARKRRAENRPDRAEVALRRARIWRAWAAGIDLASADSVINSACAACSNAIHSST